MGLDCQGRKQAPCSSRGGGLLRQAGGKLTFAFGFEPPSLVSGSCVIVNSNLGLGGTLGRHLLAKVMNHWARFNVDIPCERSRRHNARLLLPGTCSR